MRAICCTSNRIVRAGTEAPGHVTPAPTLSDGKPSGRFIQPKVHTAVQRADQGITHELHDRRSILLTAVTLSASACVLPCALWATEPKDFSDEQWRSLLTRKQYNVLRNSSTELPFSSPLNKEARSGTFQCAGCNNAVFESAAKFDSGTGWPSFFEAVPGGVNEVDDNSIFFLPRTEVQCSRCSGHLGHVFKDGPQPTGLRYCMNGVALTFTPSDDK